MAEPSYKVKVIKFKNRRVPIMLQDINGPCPLLAIANVLLLRNQLQLPAGVGEVSQARLVEMVARLLLDANSLEGRVGVSEEQVASLQQNLSDAIALLPQLCTGVDVNLHFHDIRGFEYTRETAVFDLLDIQLVHGWCVDPQDQATAAVVCTKSYNELVVQLVTALGSAATPMQLTPTASLCGAHQFGSGEVLTPRGSGAAVAAGAAAQQQQPQQQQTMQGTQGQQIDADMLSAALHDTLHMVTHATTAQMQQQQQVGEAAGGSSEPASARADGGSSMAVETTRVSSNLSIQTSDSMHSMHSVVNRMLTDLVSDAFTATPTASHSTGQACLAMSGSSHAGGVDSGGGEEGEEEATSVLHRVVELSLAVEDGNAERPVQAALLERHPLQLPSPFDSPGTQGFAALQPHRAKLAAPHASLDLLDEEEEEQQQQQQQWTAAGAATYAPMTPHTSAAALEDQQVQQAAAAAMAATATAGLPPAQTPPAAGGSGETSPGKAAVRDALLVQQFLEGSPSQLTYHGLMALHEGLQPNQLAVFFRNNHFNTLFKGPNDQLFILATDEGFQFESDVVWEALDSVDGNTQLVDAEFRPFRPHTSQQDTHERQAAAQDAEWAEVADAAAAAGGDTHDADLALAMQLQAEEEERVRLEQRRRQQEEQRRRQQVLAQQQEERRRQAQQQGRPSSGESVSSSDGSSSAKKKKEKKSSSDCCIQ